MYRPPTYSMLSLQVSLTNHKSPPLLNYFHNSRTTLSLILFGPENKMIKIITPYSKVEY
uniref:Uncharacterized protein n=1 Tax=Anguilla anguilla TaxID=7936 RepID=A0A0E9WYG2_ANGAN